MCSVQCTFTTMPAQWCLWNDAFTSMPVQRCIAKRCLHSHLNVSETWPTPIQSYSIVDLYVLFLNIDTGETSQVITSRHFSSHLFTSFHFYVYSNFFGSYQLKGKYNTHPHIEKLNILHNFSSLLTPTSIINWKAKTIQIY